jgi:hypothetical protein
MKKLGSEPIILSFLQQRMNLAIGNGFTSAEVSMHEIENDVAYYGRVKFATTYNSSTYGRMWRKMRSEETVLKRAKLGIKVKNNTSSPETTWILTRLN